MIIEEPSFDKTQPLHTVQASKQFINNQSCCIHPKYVLTTYSKLWNQFVDIQLYNVRWFGGFWHIAIIEYLCLDSLIITHHYKTQKSTGWISFNIFNIFHSTMTYYYHRKTLFGFSHCHSSLPDTEIHCPNFMQPKKPKLYQPIKRATVGRHSLGYISWQLFFSDHQLELTQLWVVFKNSHKFPHCKLQTSLTVGQICKFNKWVIPVHFGWVKMSLTVVITLIYTTLPLTE